MIKIGFEFDIFEAATSPEHPQRTEIEYLLNILRAKNGCGVYTMAVAEQFGKLAKYQQQNLEIFLSRCTFEKIAISEKADVLAEDYLMYGVIDRKNKRAAQNIAAYTIHETPLYVTLTYSQLGKYISRKKISALNRKRNYLPIDMGSPTHAAQALLKPDFVKAIHRAQEEAYQTKDDLTLTEEIQKTRRRARQIIWTSSSDS